MMRVNIDVANDKGYTVHRGDCPVAMQWMDNPGPRKIIVRLGDNPDRVVIDSDHTGGWVEMSTIEEARAYHQKKYPCLSYNGTPVCCGGTRRKEGQ